MKKKFHPIHSLLTPGYQSGLTENDDAEFEKEVFSQIGLDLTIKKLILS